ALEIIDNLRSIEKQDKYYNSNLENAYYEIKNLISKNKINEETYYYAIGLSYKNDKIERISLYSKFANALIIKGEIKKFIQERHDIQIKEEFENVWYYAIDYYENKEEIKVYEEPFIFKEKMNDEILNKVFHNKECVKVSKYRDNHKIDEKFEFEYDRILTNEEKDILRQNKLFDKQYKILAFYIRDGEIFKKTMYNL
nr:hypothetical protein [Candidatus Woesearchaeota archaeon]